jgi:hypothetical protein
MAPIDHREPQSAADYDDRTTAAVKAVLIEIGQILGSYQRRFVVVGGAVPWLLLGDAEMPHIGTIDIDLGLDTEALGDGDYATLIQALLDHGYEQHRHRRRFQLVRQVPVSDDGAPIDVVVDFLMPRNARIVQNDPPIIDEFAVQRADGADLALRFCTLVVVEGNMPDGGSNSVSIAVASIPALLAMKGFAINNRLKRKDAYDIYYCVRNNPGGPEALAEDCRPLLEHAEGNQGYGHIEKKFETIESFGPTSVRRFVENTQILQNRTPEQWQQDAYGQVDAWLRALGLRA